MSTSEEVPNRISDVFKGKSILITGGSGFIGKVLIEKLLRCTEIAKIYLLLRNKKGKRPQDRLDDIFANVLFNVLKAERKDYLSICHVIAGDVSEPDLGISAEDRKLLEDEVDFIVHSAASTRFDDTIRRAVRLNTRGIKYVLDLAENCKKLEVFLHVSTAYVCPEEEVLYEKVYEPPADPHRVLEVIDFSKGDHEPDEHQAKMLMGDSPNTYTFSKALAEALVAEKFGKLPVLIVRPSVVCPIWKGPLPGWCNSLQGPMGIFVGAGKGIIRTMYVNPESRADFIPADVCVNGLMVSIWAMTLEQCDFKVVHLTSSNEFSITWQGLVEIGKGVIYNEIPFNWAIWYPGGSMNTSKLVHIISFYLLQLIPALFLDLLLIIFGHKPIVYNIQRRIGKGAEVFEYYTDKNWKFKNDTGVYTVRPLLNEKERSVYKIDAEGVDLKDYLKECILSLRRNILRETDDTIPTAKRHMKVMYVIDKLFKAFFVLAIFNYLYKWISKPIFELW